jgi:replicative DNA helicase
MSDTDRSLGFLNTQVHASMPTGIASIDEANLGPARKRLHLMIGLPKKGKSWWLVHLAKQAFKHRLRTVYITLELDQDEVCQRLVQAIFSVSKRKAVQQVGKFETDEHGKFVDYDMEALKRRPSFEDANIATKLTQRMDGMKRRTPVIVKEFPTGYLTAAELERYLDSLEATTMVPDLVLIDYPDLMEVDSSNYRIDVGNLYKRIRGMAVKRNLAIAVVSQANREAGRARVITSENVAEDYSKIATADAVFTYNQTEEEKELGLARIFVARARTGGDGFMVIVSQAYAIGQFALDSARFEPRYWEAVGGDDNGK